MGYYVYAHHDMAGTIVYIGKGSKGRCLDFSKRSPEHYDFMDKSIDQGLGFVEILKAGLTDDQARAIERRLIKKLKPLFNKQMNGAANAGRGPDNHNSCFSQHEVENLRKSFADFKGSKREFHRQFLKHVAWTTALKIMNGVSYGP